MRLTSTDIAAILLLIKRLITGIMIGGKYIIVGNVNPSAITNKEVQSKEVVVTNTPSKKRRLRQMPHRDIPDEVYEIPAITRLHKVNLEEWEAANLFEIKPTELDLMVKKHLNEMTTRGLKPSRLYWDV